MEETCRLDIGGHQRVRTFEWRFVDSFSDPMGGMFPLQQTSSNLRTLVSSCRFHAGTVVKLNIRCRGMGHFGLRLTLLEAVIHLNQA
jgi:hypothetical protein